MKTIVIIPGTVVSKEDGQEHYIDTRKLAELCGVKRGGTAHYKTIAYHDHKDVQGVEADIFEIRPRSDGNYASVRRKLAAWLLK